MRYFRRRQITLGVGWGQIPSDLRSVLFYFCSCPSAAGGHAVEVLCISNFKEPQLTTKCFLKIILELCSGLHICIPIIF